MKYKPCCDRRCLRAGCKTREAGGCSCVCNIQDGITTLESVIEGLMVSGGSCYIPDPAVRYARLAKMTEEGQQAEKRFREIEAPELLEKCKARLKEYEMD